jgi:lipopolysaccharide export system protein LptC
MPFKYTILHSNILPRKPLMGSFVIYQLTSHHWGITRFISPHLYFFFDDNDHHNLYNQTALTARDQFKVSYQNGFAKVLLKQMCFSAISSHY